VALAVSKHLSPDPKTRGDGLEKIWDAFDRAKTFGAGKDKRARAQSVIAAAAAAPDEAQLLETEMMQLTDIGNAFRIRHHEVSRPNPPDKLVDYLFGRVYFLLYRLHPALR
jgi:hypothetical protein